MTEEKEILIDGVNVAGCPFYQYQTPDDYEMRYPESGDCEIGMAGYLYEYDRIREELEKECISNSNCSYKQLKRLEQENAQLKNERTADLAKQLKRLQSENEQLKVLCDTYKTFYRVKHDDIKGKLLSYRKALEEIREILKGNKDGDIDEMIYKISEVLE